MKKFYAWLNNLYSKARGRNGIISMSIRRGLITILFIPFAIVCSILLLLAMPFAFLLDKLMEFLENDV